MSGYQCIVCCHEYEEHPIKYGKHFCILCSGSVYPIDPNQKAVDIADYSSSFDMLNDPSPVIW